MNNDNTGSEYTFWEHFEELRGRIIRCLIYLFLGAVAGLFFAEPVLRFLIKPLTRAEWAVRDAKFSLVLKEDGGVALKGETDDFFASSQPSAQRFVIVDEKTGRRVEVGPDSRRNFYYFNPVDPFLLWLKASLIVGFALSLAFIMREVWGFVSPGMTVAEKKAAVPVLAGGAFLFPVGAAFAYFLLSFALGFFDRYSFPGLEPRIGVMEYLSFALTMMLAFGIVFELPIFILILSWMGVVNSAALRKYRKHAIVALFAMAALVTPPDVMTMMAIGLPLLGLYEISIMLARLMERKRKTAD